MNYTIMTEQDVPVIAKKYMEYYNHHRSWESTFQHDRRLRRFSPGGAGALTMQAVCRNDGSHAKPSVL